MPPVELIKSSLGVDDTRILLLDSLRLPVDY